MPETRYAGDLIEHRLKYMADFLFGLGESWKDEPVPGQTLPFRLRGCCTSERLGAALREGDFGRILRPGHPKVKRKTEVVLEAKR